MTEADEAVERLTAQLNHLVSLESVGVMVKTTVPAAIEQLLTADSGFSATVGPLSFEY